MRQRRCGSGEYQDTCQPGHPTTSAAPATARLLVSLCFVMQTRRIGAGHHPVAHCLAPAPGQCNYRQGSLCISRAKLPRLFATLTQISSRSNEDIGSGTDAAGNRELLNRHARQIVPPGISRPHGARDRNDARTKPVAAISRTEAVAPRLLRPPPKSFGRSASITAQQTTRFLHDHVVTLRSAAHFRVMIAEALSASQALRMPAASNGAARQRR
jgi:hypothetical protein